MRQNTTKAGHPRLQHKYQRENIAAMFDEIPTQNHQESLPKNSTNGADVFLKSILSWEMEDWPQLGLDTQERLPILMRSYWHYWFLILVRLFCALWTIWSLWEDAMAHEGRRTDSQQTSVFVWFLFCAAYLMKIWWFILYDWENNTLSCVQRLKLTCEITELKNHQKVIIYSPLCCYKRTLW